MQSRGGSFDDHLCLFLAPFEQSRPHNLRDFPLAPVRFYDINQVTDGIAHILDQDTMRLVDSVVNLERPSGITYFRSVRTTRKNVKFTDLVYVSQVVYQTTNIPSSKAVFDKTMI